MLRQLFTLFVLCVSLFSQQAYAISAIHIQVDEVDAPAGKLKNSQFQVNFKGAQPTLTLHAEVKPAHQKAFIPLDLKCAVFNTDKIGQVDCLNGSFTTKQIKVPFSLNLVSSPNYFSLNLAFNHADFSDESGLHAGEKLTGQIKLSAKNSHHDWQWNGSISWDQGELFWQPFYFGKAGNKFDVNGTFKAPMLNVVNASLLINEVGKMTGSGQFNTQTKVVEDIKVSAKEVDFSGLYAIFLKPMVEKSVFGNLEVSGKADWQFEIKNLEPSSFELNLRDANIEDKNGKFAFKNINAHLPWDYDNAKTVNIAYKSGHVLKMPLGNTNLKAEINRYSFSSPHLTLPI